MSRQYSWQFYDIAWCPDNPGAKQCKTCRRNPKRYPGWSGRYVTCIRLEQKHIDAANAGKCTEHWEDRG